MGFNINKKDNVPFLTSGLVNNNPSREEDQMRKARRTALSILKGTRKGAQTVNKILSLRLRSRL